MKLYGKLLISMATAGALALAALAVTMNWRLGQGFVDFVNAADAERLPPIALSLTEHYIEHGDWETLRDDNSVWRSILVRARDIDEAEDRVDPEWEQRQRATRHRQSDPWSPLWPRLVVFTPELEVVVGRFEYADTGRHRAVTVGGQTVGWVGMHEVSQVNSRVAEAFLADQRQGLLWASLAMAIMLVISAAVLARAWTRPIERIGKATRRLAGGDFSARVGRSGKDEIGELARDIDFLAHSLAEADAARKRWMADTAHELRTPLAVLKGELEALQDGIRPFDRDAVASLHAETQHLGALIEELRELALADVGALDYRMETVDLAELVRDCLDANAGRLRQHPLTVVADMPPQPVLVQGDARRLRQLLENLLENSLRYTDPDGRLELQLSQHQDRVELTVDDSPPGVPEQALPTLFDPFTRADAARSRAKGGSGLGLAICQRIAEAHGGSIVASASALGGLRMALVLPTREPHRP
ncbi:MAG: ATP-binding protein [Xanthomonadales bacterium]|nr:ATP-binding protein [Xanthomonadales bacterium]